MLFKLRKDATYEETGPDLAPAPPRAGPRSPSDALKPMPAPAPPPRIRPPRGGLLAGLSGFLSLILVIALAAMFGLVTLDQHAREPGSLPDDKVVLIPRSTGTGEIADLLAREGVINQPRLFELYAYLNRQRGQLKAGEFLFKARVSMDDAMDTLIQGKAILHSFTAPEGLTSEQIVARMRDNEILTGDLNEIPREGTLLPDTYRFERGTTRQQLVNLMQEKQRQMLNQVWARRTPDLPIRTPQELLILASIVEKETGRGDERARVAGVFINRLARRMKLQSDPTIVYGLVAGKGTLGRGILRSEIEKPTPYNTYVIEGLPPGPIANPGRAALEAVAGPARTKDLYFVADGAGGHAFAETLDQHQRNVLRWRQVERSREEAPVDRAEPLPLPDVRTDAAPGSPSPAAPRGPGASPGPAPRTTAGTPPGRSRGAAAATTAPPQPQPRPGSVDASEGTQRDPLLNRSYDLNTPKIVPALRPQ
jgi:UPF0755 protein